MNIKLKSYFGFAKKSRNLVSGYDTCENLIKRNKIKLIIITGDASERTREKFRKLTEKAEIPFYMVESSALMEELTGLEGRNIFGITDENFAKAIAKEITDMTR